MAADPRRALVLVDQHTAGRESIWRGVWAAIVRILSGASSRDHYTHATQARAAREIADLVRVAQEEFQQIEFGGCQLDRPAATSCEPR